MRTVESLIDEASDLCKGDSALARRLGVPRQTVHEWRTGKRALSPETVGVLCDLLELRADEARRLLALSVVLNPKNTEKAEVLRRAFFVGLMGGAVVCGLLTTNPAQAKTPQSVTRIVDAIYIVALWLVRLMGGTWRAAGVHQGLRPRYPGACSPRFAAPPLG